MFIKTRQGLETSTRPPLLPHLPAPHIPVPFLLFSPLHPEVTSCYLKYLLASSRSTLLEPSGQAPGNMARPQATSRTRVCACVQDIEVHTEEGSPESPTSHRCILTPRPVDAGRYRHIQQYRDCAAHAQISSHIKNHPSRGSSGGSAPGSQADLFPRWCCAWSGRAGAPSLLGGVVSIFAACLKQFSHWPLKQPRHSFLCEANTPSTPTSNTLF